MVVLVKRKDYYILLYHSCFTPSYCSGSWTFYGYGTDMAADARHVTVVELIWQWISLC